MGRAPRFAWPLAAAIVAVALALAPQPPAAEAGPPAGKAGTALPDLIPASIREAHEHGNDCRFPSTDGGVAVTVQNIGTADAGPFTVEADGIAERVAGGLEAGGSVSLWFGVDLSAGSVTVSVDTAGEVGEANEGNNVFEASVIEIPPVAPCTPTPPPGGLPGDADCSGSVTAIDAALILQFIAALTDSLPCEQLADANGSATLDAIDATLVLQFVAGLLGEL